MISTVIGRSGSTTWPGDPSSRSTKRTYGDCSTRPAAACNRRTTRGRTNPARSECPGTGPHSPNSQAKGSRRTTSPLRRRQRKSFHRPLGSTGRPLHRHPDLLNSVITVCRSRRSPRYSGVSSCEPDTTPAVYRPVRCGRVSNVRWRVMPERPVVTELAGWVTSASAGSAWDRRGNTLAFGHDLVTRREGCRGGTRRRGRRLERAQAQ